MGGRCDSQVTRNAIESRWAVRVSPRAGTALLMTQTMLQLPALGWNPASNSEQGDGGEMLGKDAVA